MSSLPGFQLLPHGPRPMHVGSWTLRLTGNWGFLKKVDPTYPKLVTQSSGKELLWDTTGYPNFKNITIFGMSQAWYPNPSKHAPHGGTSIRRAKSWARKAQGACMIQLLWWQLQKSWNLPIKFISIIDIISHDGSMVLVYMLTWLGYIDGTHGTPYIAAPWIRHGFVIIMSHMDGTWWNTPDVSVEPCFTTRMGFFRTRVPNLVTCSLLTSWLQGLSYPLVTWPMEN